MTDTSDRDGEPALIVLPAIMDLGTAESLHALLLKHIQAGTRLVVGGATVERVCTPVLQLLLVAAAEADARLVPFQLRDASPPLTEALAELGLGGHFAS